MAASAKFLIGNQMLDGLSRRIRRCFLIVFAAAIFSNGLASCANSELTVSATPELIWQQGHRSALNALVLSPDGRILASAGKDGTLKLWNAQSGELTHILSESGNVKKDFWDVIFSPDGQTVVSSDFDGMKNEDELLAWDAHSGALKKVLIHQKGESLGKSVFLQAGKTLALTVQNGNGPGNQITLIDTAKLTAKHGGIKTQGAILSLAASPANNVLATASDDGLVKIWDTASGRLKRTFKGSGKALSALAFSPNGKTIAVAISSDDPRSMPSSTLFLWDAASGKTLRSFARIGAVNSLLFSADGKILISGGATHGDGQIQFDDLATGKTKRIFEGRCDSTFQMSLSRDGRTLATAGLTQVAKTVGLMNADYFEGDIQLWNVALGTVNRTIRGSGDSCTTVKLTADGSRIIEQGWEPRGPDFNDPSPREYMSIWDAHSGERVSTFMGRRIIVVSPNGRYLLTSHEDEPSENDRFSSWYGKNSSVARTQWDVKETKTGVVQRQLTLPDDTVAAAFSADGKTLILAGSGNDNDLQAGLRFTLWDFITGRLKKIQMGSESAGFSALTFSPDGSRLVGSRGYDLGVWSTSTGKLERKLLVSGPADSVLSQIENFNFSPDGKMILGRSGAGLIWWDAESGKQIRALPTDGYASNGMITGLLPVAISPDSKIFATETRQCSIKLWNFQTGKLIREFAAHSDMIMAMAFSPDGLSLVSCSYDGTTKIWRVGTGELRATLVRFPVKSIMAPVTSSQWIAFTPKGYFQASKEALPLIRWRVGNEVLPAEAFPNQERPDLLAAALAP